VSVFKNIFIPPSNIYLIFSVSLCLIFVYLPHLLRASASPWPIPLLPFPHLLRASASPRPIPLFLIFSVPLCQIFVYLPHLLCVSVPNLCISSSSSLCLCAKSLYIFLIFSVSLCQIFVYLPHLLRVSAPILQFFLFSFYVTPRLAA
jgi:hypothetical protein